MVFSRECEVTLSSCLLETIQNCKSITRQAFTETASGPSIGLNPCFGGACNLITIIRDQLRFNYVTLSRSFEENDHCGLELLEKISWRTQDFEGKSKIMLEAYEVEKMCLG